ncbi:DUF7114 family protein [Natronolimnohabitans innermongolicus]|uniref:Uncharacterized protein n=1 Tax=Natronolimnohabitans innermongolicus JCM 12255 TaxID=1227499 RepID=L9X5Q8_9EURY|nr:hypothetical protein [Natronolimnohabitans innermongolicus]ELY57005.1 hypothetical protein C493_09263 [Natronolimnohabitans innermongolicus JCM 12255]
MDRADSCRRAAAEAVADVEPAELHDRIEATLADASMVPGVLTLESAAATATDGRVGLETEADELATQAAGVQLIYEGLRLTRSLAHDEPWTSADDVDAELGDLEILAADILVARGFYLLARTDAAGKAVRTVQAFGRNQTHRDELSEDAVSGGVGDGDNRSAIDRPEDADGDPTDPDALDATLEHHILELAVLTGAAAVDETPTQRLLTTADDLADRVGTSFPPAADCLGDLEPTPTEQSLDDPTTDRATSATDS